MPLMGASPLHRRACAALGLAIVGVALALSLIGGSTEAAAARSVPLQEDASLWPQRSAIRAPQARALEPAVAGGGTRLLDGASESGASGSGSGSGSGAGDGGDGGDGGGTAGISSDTGATGSSSSGALETPEEVVKEEVDLFLGIFLALVVLTGGMLIVYMLRRYELTWFPEAWVFFGIGNVIALAAVLSSPSELHVLVSHLNGTFGSVFFVLLLPPIIFEAGYSMNREAFFANFGAICMFAFGGTLLSAAIVGVLLWLAGVLGISYAFSLLDALIFGAMISATDPVTVLAVFQALGADRTLYALVFGESVLNDAVAIVLYHTLMEFQDGASATGIVQGMLFFVANFVGSLVIGVVASLLSALLFKYTDMRGRQLRGLERALSVLTPFLAYMLAEGVRVSGVVAILFAGITDAHYKIRNLSLDSRRFSLQFFKALATLFEALVFVYIGLTTPLLFTKLAGDNWSLLVVVLLVVLFARYVIVYAGAAVVNRCRRPRQAISKKMQFVIWFSGLRGGVAFALAASAQTILTDREGASLIVLSTLFIVVATMLLVGGSIGPLLHKVDLVENPSSSRRGSEDPEFGGTGAARVSLPDYRASTGGRRTKAKRGAGGKPGRRRKLRRGFWGADRAEIGSGDGSDGFGNSAGQGGAAATGGDAAGKSGAAAAADDGRGVTISAAAGSAASDSTPSVYRGRAGPSPAGDEDIGSDLEWHVKDSGVPGGRGGAGGTGSKRSRGRRRRNGGRRGTGAAQRPQAPSLWARMAAAVGAAVDRVNAALEAADVRPRGARAAYEPVSPVELELGAPERRRGADARRGGVDVEAGDGVGAAGASGDVARGTPPLARPPHARSRSAPRSASGRGAGASRRGAGAHNGNGSTGTGGGGRDGSAATGQGKGGDPRRSRAATGASKEPEVDDFDAALDDGFDDAGLQDVDLSTAGADGLDRGAPAPFGPGAVVLGAKRGGAHAARERAHSGGGGGGADGARRAALSDDDRERRISRSNSGSGARRGSLTMSAPRVQGAGGPAVAASRAAAAPAAASADALALSGGATADDADGMEDIGDRRGVGALGYLSRQLRNGSWSTFDENILKPIFTGGASAPTGAQAGELRSGVSDGDSGSASGVGGSGRITDMGGDIETAGEESVVSPSRETPPPAARRPGPGHASA